VHSFGMRAPLLVLTLDGEGRVRRGVLLRPGRVLVDRGAAWILELPASVRPPPVGTVLRPVPMLDGCPED
jgi:hypothetical protein